MNKPIDIKAALEFGWNTLRNNFGLYLKLLLVLVIAMLIPSLIVGRITLSLGRVWALPFQLINLVWQTVLGMGALVIGLKLHDGQAVQIGDLWSAFPRSLDYIVVKLVYGIIIMVGLVLLIIPGLVWWMQFCLASFLVIDRGAGVGAALRGSSEVTKGAKWNLGVFYSVLLLVNILGILCLGVGILITIPITLMATIYTYRSLLKQSEAAGQTV